MEQKWPQEIWLVRHGQSAGNVARDAADAALISSFGAHELKEFTVWTDEVDG